MKNPPKELDILKKKIEDCFGLTPETKSDYERLATRISNKLKEVFSEEKELYTPGVSGTTISRIWGYAKSDGEISKTTWSTLARSLGYKGWDDFCNSDHSDHKDNVNNESVTTVEETTVDSSNGSSEDNVNNHDESQELNIFREGHKRHYITDLDTLDNTDDLLVGDTLYFGWPGRYAELKYKGDCEFEIIDHIDKMRIGEPITARWFEKVQIKNRNCENMYEDIAGVVGESQDRLYL